MEVVPSLLLFTPYFRFLRMKVPKTNPTKTVLIISIGFILVFLLTKAHWAIIVALIIGIIGAFSSYLSRQIDFVWMKLSRLLSLIIPNILLSIIFYLFLFPIALMSRLFLKKDPLMLKNTHESVFKSSNKKFEKTSFEKPW